MSEEEEEAMSDEDKVKRFARMTARDMSCKAVCVIVSQPLQVREVHVAKLPQIQSSGSQFHIVTCKGKKEGVG